MIRTEVRTTGLAIALTAIGVALLIPLGVILLNQIGQPAFSLLAHPVVLGAKIAPAFLAGQRIKPHHPLIGGFTAGALAVTLINGIDFQPQFEPFSLLGEAVGAGLICAVSMLAGQSLARLRAAT